VARSPALTFGAGAVLGALLGAGAMFVALQKPGLLSSAIVTTPAVPQTSSVAETAVKETMYDAESARFRNVARAPGTAITWCGEVNGKNRFGGMVGFKRFVVLLDPRRPTDPRDATVHIETDNDDSSFQGRWNVYCTG
jgi:hypothetical protein